MRNCRGKSALQYLELPPFQIHLRNIVAKYETYINHMNKIRFRITFSWFHLFAIAFFVEKKTFLEHQEVAKMPLVDVWVRKVEELSCASQKFGKFIIFSMSHPRNTIIIVIMIYNTIRCNYVS